MEGFTRFEKKKKKQQQTKTLRVDECVLIDQQEGLS